MAKGECCALGMAFFEEATPTGLGVAWEWHSTKRPPLRGWVERLMTNFYELSWLKPSV
ncbi:MAG: hypothetical protein J0L94_04270 [Rhodothermia bacterium]|nr:hypothetical protein [Rhodothermia bacterium]